MTNFYVYYRVDVERLDELRLGVEQLFATVASETGVTGRWMHRSDDPATRMEVYEGVSDERAFEALLEREAVKLGVTRKTERFVCA